MLIQISTIIRQQKLENEALKQRLEDSQLDAAETAQASYDSPRFF